jgi:ElaB/YqjD/DUF883 family membrane-anchored ribosome-binding protein
MDQEPNLTQKNPEEIRRDIEHTRASLTEKLETLEQGVKDSVKSATNAVVDTVETVKQTVESTVDSVKGKVEGTVQTVKETFSFSHQVDEHPWAVVGSAFVAGFVIGSFLTTGRSRQRVPPPESNGRPGPPEFSTGPVGLAKSDFAPITEPPAAAREPQPRRPGFWSEALSTFAPEIEQAKKLAIGAALGVVRDILKDSVPENMSPQVEDLVNRVTSKLGGEPVPGRVA